MENLFKSKAKTEEKITVKGEIINLSDIDCKKKIGEVVMSLCEVFATDPKVKDIITTMLNLFVKYNTDDKKMKIAYAKIKEIVS